MEQIKTAPLSTLLITLLKGVIYRDKNPDLWQGLSSLYAQVAELKLPRFIGQKVKQHF
jgi:hypothetical protein